MAAIRLTITVCLFLFSAPGLAQEVSDFEQGLEQWNNLKAAQTPVCNADLDSYEILQGKKTDYAVLVIHGFTLNPHSMDHYVQLFAGLGANVIAPRLARHHTLDNDRDLDQVSYREWVDQIEAAYKAASLLGRKVVVAGFSLGGLLAMKLATRHPEIDSLYLFSPALRMSSAANGGALIGWLPRLSLNDVGNKLPVGCGHPLLSARAGMQIHSLMSEEAKLGGTYPAPEGSIYKKLKMPMLMGLAGADNAIDNNQIAHIFRWSQSRLKSYVYFAEGSHGMWTDPETLNLPSKRSYEGHDGESLRQQILSFWADSHQPGS